MIRSPDMFYNLHTHISSNDAEVVEIVNIEPSDELLPGKIYSTGIHPWHIDRASESWVEDVEKKLASPQVVALGECGLDKQIATSIRQQEAIFQTQIDLAESYKRPLIIHCVKAWQELLSIKKRHNPQMPWIIHGFRGNAQLAEQLLTHGLYLSFGFYFQSESLKVAWPEKVFLETDDRPVAIQTIYTAASEALQVSESAILKQMSENFSHCFAL